jgi:hypothetical protein
MDASRVGVLLRDSAEARRRSIGFGWGSSSCWAYFVLSGICVGWVGMSLFSCWYLAQLWSVIDRGLHHDDSPSRRAPGCFGMHRSKIEYSAVYFDSLHTFADTCPSLSIGGR